MRKGACSGRTTHRGLAPCAPSALPVRTARPALGHSHRPAHTPLRTHEIPAEFLVRCSRGAKVLWCASKTHSERRTTKHVRRPPSDARGHAHEPAFPPRLCAHRDSDRERRRGVRHSDPARRRRRIRIQIRQQQCGGASDERAAARSRGNHPQGIRRPPRPAAVSRTASSAATPTCCRSCAPAQSRCSTFPA